MIQKLIQFQQTLRRENFITAADIRNAISKYTDGQSGDAAETDYLLRSLMEEEESPVVHYKRNFRLNVHFDIIFCSNRFRTAGGFDDNSGLGLLKKDLFIVLMSTFQRQQLVRLYLHLTRLETKLSFVLTTTCRYHRYCIAIDATHGTTQYGYKLITVAVINDMNKVYQTQCTTTWLLIQLFQIAGSSRCVLFNRSRV